MNADAASSGDRTVVDVLRSAAARRGSVRLVYGSVERRVDVRSVDATHVRGYCHLREQVLAFRLDLVTRATPIASSDPLF